MKKFLSHVISTAVCTGVLLSTALSAAAEPTVVEPQYPIHGNKCGYLVAVPALDRDVSVKITQITPDGDYVYYDTVVSAENKDGCSFILEGKDDSTYKLSIKVPKYKGSADMNSYDYEFTVKDTDNNVNDVIARYDYMITIAGSSDADKPELTYAGRSEKDANDIIKYFMEITFPISDALIGDVNFDGDITLYDVIDIAKYLLNNNYFNKDKLAVADYNNDGKVDIYDAIEIAKYLIKK